VDVIHLRRRIQVFRGEHAVRPRGRVALLGMPEQPVGRLDELRDAALRADVELRRPVDPIAQVAVKHARSELCALRLECAFEVTAQGRRAGIQGARKGQRHSIQ